MKTPEQYEAEISDLREMNLNLQLQLTKAPEAMAEERRKAITREAA